MKLRAYRFDGRLHAYNGCIDVEPEMLADGGTAYILPKWSTLIEPPELLPAGKVPVWLERPGKWVVVSDHRGEIWFSWRGEQIVIDRLGNPATWGLFKTWPGQTG